MADPQPQTTDQGFLPGLLGNVGGWFGSYDPQAAYGGLLSDPATKRAFQVRELGAAAQAMAQASMPVPYKGGMPWGSFLGSAGGAAATAGDSLIKARLEQAQAQLAGYQGQLAEANVHALDMNNQLYPVALGMEKGVPGTGTGTDGKPLTGPAAIIAGKGKAVSSTTADTSLPLEARALLDTISGPESGGAYNVRWGGPNNTDVTFDDFSKHPNIPEPGPAGPSTAAGRYQIVNSTWKPLQAKYGFGDFSPATQDQAAWHLAADTYKEQTGRDLLTDLQAGKTDQVASALHGQWSTLHMGNYAANLGKYQGGGASPQTASTGDQPPAAVAPPAAPPMAPPAASRGLLDTSQGPLGSSATPPQLLIPPAAGAPGPVTGLLGQQPAQQVAAADAPQLSPAAAAILQGINRQQAGGGLLASGSVAGGNAVPTGGPSPAAVTQQAIPHTGAAGAAELAGLLAQQPPPQAPAAGPVPPAAAPAPAPAPAGPMPPAPGGAPPPGVAPPMPPPAMPPMPPQPVAPAAAPGPIAGAPTDRQIAAASIIAHNNIMMGKAVPPDIAAILNYKYAGPTAAATAAATAPITRANAAYEAQVKAQYDLWVKQSAPRDIRKGGISEDPITHQTLINPDTVRRTDPDTGNQYDYYSYPSLTGGAPTLVPLGLAVLGAGATSKLTETGRIQAGQEPQPAPQQPAPPLGTPLKPTYQGYQLAPGMMSKEPDYQEPQLNKTQIDAGYAAENWPKTTRELTSSIGAAQSAEQRLTTMATAFQQVGTGAFMSDKAAWNNTLDGVFGPGGGPAWLRTSPDAGAVMTSMHEAMRATLSNLKATNPRFANAEFQGLSKMSENPDLPISANLNMLAEDIGQLRQQQGLANGWIEARANGKQDPDIFQTKWLAENKLPPIVESVKKEIGIGKMAPSGSQPQSGQSTPAQPQRAKEGDTVYAPDGSAYVIHNGVPIHKQTLQPYQSPGGR